MLHNLVFVAFPLDAPALRALERLPSATKSPPALISPALQKHFEKAGLQPIYASIGTKTLGDHSPPTSAVEKIRS